MPYSSLKNNGDTGGPNIGFILRYVGSAYLISLVFFVVGSLLLWLTALPETAIPVMVMMVMGVSIFYGGFVVGRRARSSGWLNGGLVGLVYVLVLFLVGELVLPDVAFGQSVLLRFGFAVVVGMVAGILGVNSR